MSGNFLKILSPLDLEERSFPALRLAREIAARNGGTVYLLHVVAPDEFALLQGKYRPWETGGSDVEAACRVAQRQLERTAKERIGEHVPYEVLTRVGDPAQTLLQVEKELDADLVVMGRYNEVSPMQTGAGAPGFVDRVVRDSYCPVLTVSQR